MSIEYYRPVSPNTRVQLKGFEVENHRCVILLKTRCRLQPEADFYYNFFLYEVELKLSN